MAILVSDTATSVLAVGIGRVPEDGGDVETIFSSTATIPRAHSRWLQPTMAHGFAVSGMGSSGIDQIGVGVGPGSYTGVRLAVSTAKSMATVLGAKLYPIPTPLILAEACVLRMGMDGPRASGASPTDASPWAAAPTVVVLLNARRQRAYGAIYQAGLNGWHCVQPIAVEPLERWQLASEAVVASLKLKAGGSMLLVHDFTSEEGTVDWIRQEAFQGVPVRAMRLEDIGQLIPTAMIRLVANQAVLPVEGEDIHAVVPEYALLVEAESRLAEGISHA